MPILVTGIADRDLTLSTCRQSGFTLWELMVVVVIIGVVVSVIQLSIPNSSDRSSRQLAQQVSLAWDKACLLALQRQQLTALVLEQSQLHLRVWDGERWHTPSSMSPLVDLTAMQWQVSTQAVASLSRLFETTTHHQAWGCWPEGWRTAGGLTIDDGQMAWRVSWTKTGITTVEKFAP